MMDFITTFGSLKGERSSQRLEHEHEDIPTFCEVLLLLSRAPKRTLYVYTWALSWKTWQFLKLTCAYVSGASGGRGRTGGGGRLKRQPTGLLPTACLTLPPPPCLPPPPPHPPHPPPTRRPGTGTRS